jgi:hypothetical protein
MNPTADAIQIRPSAFCLPEFQLAFSSLTSYTPAAQSEQAASVNTAVGLSPANDQSARVHRTLESDLTEGLEAAERAGDNMLIRHYSNLLMEASLESW